MILGYRLVCKNEKGAVPGVLGSSSEGSQGHSRRCWGIVPGAAPGMLQGNPGGSPGMRRGLLQGSSGGTVWCL